jgi:DNA-binding NarL/FixJ family response regulator
MNYKVIRILIADDHALIRTGIRTILSFKEDLKVIGEAINGQDAIDNVLALGPDVIFLDVNLPDMTGLEVLKHIKGQGRGTKVVMLTADGEQDTLFQAIEAGADGYLLKDSESEDITQAVYQVCQGETYIDKRLVRYLVNQVKRQTQSEDNKLRDLTDREISVLKLIAQGMTNQEIAEKLFLSEKTVKNYATTIYRKLEVKDRVKATLYAINNDIDTFK